MSRKAGKHIISNRKCKRYMNAVGKRGQENSRLVLLCGTTIWTRVFGRGSERKKKIGSKMVRKIGREPKTVPLTRIKKKKNAARPTEKRSPWFSHRVPRDWVRRGFFFVHSNESSKGAKAVLN